MLRLIPGDVVGEQFHLYKPHVDKILEHDPLKRNSVDTLTALLDGGLQLLSVEDESGIRGVCLLQFGTNVGKKILTIWGLSYEPGYKEHEKDAFMVEELARAMGADALDYYGRFGFVKRNQKLGWKTSQVIMVKEV